MSDIITANFRIGRNCTTSSVFQYNVGMMLQFKNISLPDTYRVDFSNSLHGTSKAMIGDANGVEIPYEYFIPGEKIYAWIVLDTDATKAITEYQVEIPVSSRAKPTGDDPAPAQKNIINQAINLLNTAVATTTQNAADAESAKDAAQEAYENTEAAKEEAETARDAAILARDESLLYSQNADESAEQAELSSRAAENSASQSANSASAARNSAEQASDYSDSAHQSETEAKSAAADARNYSLITEESKNEAIQAKNAAQVAQTQAETAQAKTEQAQEAAESAQDNARQNAETAQTAAQTATAKASEAEQSATDAETAKSDAQTAQSSAEAAQIAAEEAQRAIENMTVSSTTLGAKADPAVTKTESHGVVNLDFGLPKPVSPEITVAAITNGHRITVIDVNGQHTFDVMDGRGIVSVAKTATSDLVDTYTITYTDDTTSTFTITNGKDGVTFTPSVDSNGVVSWTNDGGLPNPEPRNIMGPPGTGIDVHICAAGEYDTETRKPTILSPATNTFYLVPAENAASPDMFVEWIFANDDWEMFGSATVEVPVQDVQVNGVSVLNNGVANVPIAIRGDANGAPGVLRVLDTNGLGITTRSWSGKDGFLTTAGPLENQIKSGIMTGPVLSPSHQHSAAFYGLAKAAGADMKDIANTTVGTYPDAQKEAIQSMLGITQMLAPTNPNLVASQAYSIGDVFAANGHLYKAIVAIEQDEAIIPDTNCVETTMAEAGGKIKDVQVAGTSVVENGIANVPYAGPHTPGVVDVAETYGVGYVASNSKIIAIVPATSGQIKSGDWNYRPVPTSRQHESVFYGLSKAAGVDLANETVTLGTYPETSKTAIKNMLGVQDGLKVVRLI